MTDFFFWVKLSLELCLQYPQLPGLSFCKVMDVIQMRSAPREDKASSW